MSAARLALTLSVCLDLESGMLRPRWEVSWTASDEAVSFPLMDVLILEASGGPGVTLHTHYTFSETSQAAGHGRDK